MQIVPNNMYDIILYNQELKCTSAVRKWTLSEEEEMLRIEMTTHNFFHLIPHFRFWLYYIVRNLNFKIGISYLC